MHCVHRTTRKAARRSPTSTREHLVRIRNHEPKRAIRRNDVKIDSLTRPDAKRKSVWATMDAFRPCVIWSEVRSQTCVFQPYSSVAKMTVMVTPKLQN